MMRRFALPLLLLASLSVHAADYVALPGSTLGFSGIYQGEGFDGRFARFTPQIRFDPAKLATSRFDVRIDLASANTNNEERDDVLLGSEFFDTPKHPQARFVATRFRALGGNRYAADGTLSLHGASKPVTLSFTWTPGAKPLLVGETRLKRLDFGVGTGDWEDTELIPNEVRVRTRLLLGTAPR
jgi:polyisoprenoid-binding protein YceI